MKKKNVVKIMIAIFILCIIALLITISNKVIKKQNLNQIALENNEIIYKPNVPALSSGMVPVKKDGENWIVTTNEDPSWYDYATGTPAYIKLNDNSIYIWIPRFVYKEETTKYIPAERQFGGKWILPEMFMYKIENEKMPDYSLAGIWISVDTNSNYANTINKMTREDNTYEFISNTKPRKVTEFDITAIKKFVEERLESDLINLDSTDRIVLQIINTNKVEPIKAGISFNKEEKRIEIQVMYTKNGIKEILNEYGEKLNFTEENGIIYADTGNSGLATAEYNFTIIDNANNKKEMTIDIEVDSLFKAKYAEEIDALNNITTYTTANSQATNTEISLLNRIQEMDTTTRYTRVLSSIGGATAIAESERTGSTEKLNIYAIYNLARRYTGVTIRRYLLY